jgi:hypothetical protein
VGQVVDQLPRHPTVLSILLKKLQLKIKIAILSSTTTDYSRLPVIGVGWEIHFRKQSAELKENVQM